MKKILIGAVVGYQKYLSPYRLPCCRFYPTCSDYMKEALKNHGTMKGILLAVWRVCRCSPFFRGGFDPVPATRKNLTNK